jgi:hypothetical protein
MDFLTTPANNETTFNGRTVYSEYVSEYIRQFSVFDDMDNNFIDTWNDRRLYGRVNSWYKPCFPKLDKIISIEQKDYIYYGLDFVLDAFFEFKRYYEAMANKHKWDFKINTTSMETYIHPFELYKSYILGALKSFNSVLAKKIVDPYCLNFNDYIKEVCNVFSMQREKVVLFSSYIASVDYDLTGSGLFIDLTSASYFNDKKKVEQFFEKTHYKFLVESARRFGFLVDVNIPWRIVADLNSFSMSYFIKRRKELNHLLDTGGASDGFEQFMAAFSTENEQYMMKNGKELLLDIFNRYFSVANWGESGELNLFVDAAKISFAEFKGGKNLGNIGVYDSFYLHSFYNKMAEREGGWLWKLQMGSQKLF